MMSVLHRYCVGACGLMFATMLHAQDVPSGQVVTLQEVLIDEMDGEGWLRFRFIAPRIARSSNDISYDTAAADMEHLCASFAMPYIAEFELKTDFVAISFADQVTEFGETNPDVTQFFDVFRIKDQACIWEAF